jgi:hypothetical protein
MCDHVQRLRQSAARRGVCLQCRVCGVPVDKELASKRAMERALARAVDDPHLLDEPVGEPHTRHPLHGRWSKRYVLEEVRSRTSRQCLQVHNSDYWYCSDIAMS